jgi:excisionase family DNA binding protein
MNPIAPTAGGLLHLLTPEEVSEELGIPAGTLANWRYLGRGPAFVHLGRHVRYRKTDLAAWIESQMTGTADQPVGPP